MRKKPQFYILAFLFLIILITLACDIPNLEEPIDISEDNSLYNKYEGTGTTTWSWNKGEATCDTQDQMTLTINLTSDEVVLTSVGVCPSPKYSFEPYKFLGYCYETHPGDTCGNIIKGEINQYSKQITFDTCTAGDASGFGAASKKGVTGEVTCPANGTDPNVLKFTLLVKGTGLLTP